MLQFSCSYCFIGSVSYYNSSSHIKWRFITVTACVKKNRLFQVCFQVPFPAKFRTSQEGSKGNHHRPETKLQRSVDPGYTSASEQCVEVNQSLASELIYTGILLEFQTIMA